MPARFSLTAIDDHSLPALTSFNELRATIPGEFQVFRWDQSPRVFVFIYPDLETQAHALNRIAAFVEKADAPRGRVLSDQELSATIQASSASEQTYYVGHDYTAAALATFFNATRPSGIQLNPQEQDLQSRLRRFGFFSELANGELVAVTPERILISVAPEISPLMSASDQRLKFASLLRHALRHAEFFVNPAYQGYCLKAWNRLPDTQRQIFTEEFARLGYDTSNPLLLANEFQAFLWEPFRGIFIDARLKKQQSSLEMLRTTFAMKLQFITPSVTSILAVPGFAAPIVWREPSIMSKSVSVSNLQRGFFN